jgi:hypothetical protein
VARRHYPSDDRPYFRVLDAILDDEKLNALALEDQALYFRLLATLNRQRSKDGWGFLNRFSACALAKRERWAYAVPAYDRLAAGGLLRVEYRDGGVAYLSANWPIIQGFTPAELRHNSVQTPPLRVEEIRGEKREELHASHVDAAEPASPVDPLEKPLRLLSKEPGSAESKRAWIERELPLLQAEAERMEPDNPKARSAAFRSLAVRYWRQNLKAPPTRSTNGSGKTGHHTSDLAERARAIVRSGFVPRADAGG